MEITVELHSNPDGWVALYVNGVCERQDHGCDLFEEWLLRHFDKENGPITIKSLTTSYHEGDELDRYTERTGRFPEKLSEVHELLNPFQD